MAKVLIVEDEVLIRAFMRDVFEEAGLKVREAANVDEALELLKAQEFAAVHLARRHLARTGFAILHW